MPLALPQEQSLQDFNQAMRCRASWGILQIGMAVFAVLGAFHHWQSQNTALVVLRAPLWRVDKYCIPLCLHGPSLDRLEHVQVH